MNYADESYYTDEYLCGREEVITTAFDFYARCATVEIKRFARKNIDEDNLPDCVKMCCCELAEAVFSHEKTVADTSGKVSESVGGWSVNYESKEQSEQIFRNRVKTIIYKWLSGTGLLFAGVKIKC